MTDAVQDREHELPEQRDERLKREAQALIDNTARWLDSQGRRDLEVGISVPEFQALRGLLQSPAFGILWSLIRNAKLQHEQVLANTSLGTAASDAAASVIQGHIRAFDQLRNLLLQIADPRTAAEGEISHG